MFMIKKITLQEIAEAVYKKVNTRPTTTAEIVAMLLKEDVKELGAEDFTLGAIDSTGKIYSEYEIRMFTDALAIPKQGSVSIECESPIRWLCYWFSQSKVPAMDYIGKTTFTSNDTEDVLSLTPTNGTNEGATHFRISIMDGSGTDVLLTGRKKEIASKCKVTIKKYLGGAAKLASFVSGISFRRCVL